MALIQLPDMPLFELTLRDIEGAKTTYSYYVGLTKETARELLSVMESGGDDKLLAAKAAIASTNPRKSYIELSKRMKRAGAWNGDMIMTVAREACEAVVKQ